jgi:H+/Cl- antiporter ClcA
MSAASALPMPQSRHGIRRGSIDEKTLVGCAVGSGIAASFRL